MELPENILTRLTTPKSHAARSDWELTLDSFSERINTPASVQKYGKVSHSDIGKALKGKSKLATEQLFAECKKARSFGAMFRFLTSPKKTEA